ncbi:MAG: hypothetical protein ACHQJ6_08680 [Candidatus Berkiellales bacterium]
MSSQGPKKLIKEAQKSLVDWGDPKFLQALLNYSKKNLSNENVEFIIAVAELKAAMEAKKNRKEILKMIKKIENQFIGKDTQVLNLSAKTKELSGLRRIEAAEKEVKGNYLSSDLAIFTQSEQNTEDVKVDKEIANLQGKSTLSFRLLEQIPSSVQIGARRSPPMVQPQAPIATTPPRAWATPKHLTIKSDASPSQPKNEKSEESKHKREKALIGSRSQPVQSQPPTKEFFDELDRLLERPITFDVGKENKKAEPQAPSVTKDRPKSKGPS